MPTRYLLLLAVLLAATVFGLLWNRRNGRFTAVGAQLDAAKGEETTPVRDRLDASDLGVDLGDRATLVQFSSAFCAPCRATRQLLGDLVSTQVGVSHVEIDAESHLELVRRVGVLRTPTVLLLDESGRVVTRASGLPSREGVLAAITAIPSRVPE
ncbi:MAG: TlpA family protein disulfide reductase [Nocardioidaceae bacterium]